VESAQVAWPVWTGRRVAFAVGVMAASLALGTVCAWLTVRIGFVRFQGDHWSSPAGPLAMLVGALAYAGGPWLLCRLRGRWRPLWLVTLALVPLAVLFVTLVWPEVRDRL
jgi:hypothetical protein